MSSFDYVFQKTQFASLLSLCAAQDLFATEKTFLAQHGLTVGTSQTGNVFPEQHCQYAVGDWPSFQSKQDLQNDVTWSKYLSSLVCRGACAAAKPQCK